jgi:hypothetical protein
MMIARSRFVSTVVLVTALGLSLPAAGASADQGRGRGAAKKADRADKPGKADKAGKNAQAVVVDREGHVRIVREYTRGGTLPPGLAKRESLPPGLRKQLRERGTLPPGLRKHLVPVHPTFATRLPAIPAYYDRYFAGDDLIVVDTRTNRIVAIIRDIWG